MAPRANGKSREQEAADAYRQGAGQATLALRPADMRQVNSALLSRHSASIIPSSPERRETEMVGKRIFVVLAVAANLSILGAAPVAAGNQTRWWERGGFVKPCSLDGVNPAFHPGIFGNRATARSYGFLQSQDGAWHVIPNCRPF